MKKKLLLPTDFSKNAWNALKYASELYKNEEVDFYLLHAFTVDNYRIESMAVPEPGEKNYEEAKGKAEKNFKKLFQQIELLEVPANHSYFSKVVFNTPLEAVKQFIEDKDIDMVVISNKGVSDDAKSIMGSNSVNFMEKIRNCPVFMIPGNVAFKEPNEIVFPTSFKTHFKRRELNYLYEISKITNAPIRIFHVAKEEKLSKDQQEKRELLKECFDGLNFTFHTEDHDDIQEALHHFLKSRDSEMIAFINKKHGFFENIFSKSMVKKLGFNTNIPVLTLHDLRN
ncbi:universal stress protein [Mesonia maritima]|uniref:Nucleotide-binding universal stress UspA family protein n=1 Tax=Mesonia maritima TaxID=1793873 RepID=A0ABU1K7E9_9FLAO|nr:universal stress protein [Mesonia maritima]MDR6301546.1 nucleotide-binding universal stress UspA family protein [Mesonia maritima]